MAGARRIPKIVKGNDFEGLVPLKQFVTSGGETVSGPFPLNNATDVQVRLVNENQQRYEMEWEIAPSRNDMLLLHIEGSLQCGFWSLELTGRYEGDKIRTFIERLFEIVHSNDQADEYPNDDGEVELDPITIYNNLTVSLGNVLEERGVTDMMEQLYAAIILALNDKLSRTENDTANGHITFLQGLTSKTISRLMGGADFGQFLSGYIGGMGGRIDSEGNGELESLMVRSFLEVPELRFNRITVKAGDEWRTNGGGLVERVVPDETGTGGYANTGTLWLHLEDGEAGTLQVNDKCKGIFHNLTGENDTTTTDDGAGGRTFKGFCTCYFVVTGVYNDGGINNRITYELRPCTSDGCWAHDPDETTGEVRSTGIRGGFHPQAQMTVAQYSNASDRTRQNSTYYTTKYIRMLRQMTGWDEHLYNVGMQLGGMNLIESAYGTESEKAAHATDYFLWIDGSIYFSGTLDKVDSWGRPVEEYPDQGEFTLTADYYYNDLVHYNGIVWRCVYAEKDETGTYKPLRTSHDGVNCVPGTDNHWVAYIYAQGLKPLGHWQSNRVPYSGNSIVNLGGTVFVSNKETSNPPLGLLLNGAGTGYVLNGEGDYIIVDENANEDWDVLLNVGDIANGVAGQDAIAINLTNDNDSVFTDEHGNIPSGTVFPTTTAQFFVGLEQQTAGVTWAIDWSKTSGVGTQTSPLASINTTTGVLTTWGMSADRAVICIVATYKGNTYPKEFTFHKTFGKDKLWIECDHNVIKYDPNTQRYSPMSLQVRAYIKQGATGSVQEITEQSGLGYIRYSVNGQSNINAYHGSVITVGDNSFIGDHLILTLYSSDGTIEDVEDIPRVFDGLNAKTLLAEYSADGITWHSTYQDGDMWMHTKQEGDSQWGAAIKIVGEDGGSMRYDFAISKSKVSASSTTAPTNVSPAGWTDQPQAVTAEFPYLWMKMTPVDHDGTPTGAAKYVRLTGERGQSIYKSTVFIRSNSTPATPEGGNFDSPRPTTEGWADGIPATPAGHKIWASTRIFTSDGLSPQQAVWSAPQQQSDTATYEVEFSMSVTQPAAPNNDNTADGNGQEALWYDPDKDASNPHAVWTQMNWRAERTCKNGVWGNWVISRIKGEKGDKGQSTFKSTVFKRSNTAPATPSGGSYNSPIPETSGWTDGIPATPEGQIIWASTRIFTSDGLSPQQAGWSTPRQQSDTATYNVRFSMSDTEPVAPTDSNTANGSGNEALWYDTIKDANNSHANWTRMQWRAERNCVNGVWGNWVITRIWGEKGEKGDKGDGFRSRGQWVTGTVAKVGDVFIFGDALYLTTQANEDVPPVMSLLLDGAGRRVLNGSGGYVIVDEATNTDYYTLWLRAPITIIDKYVEYAIGENGQTRPTTGWSKTEPTVEDGVYVWSRAVTVYSDGDKVEVYAVRRTGIDGNGIADSHQYFATTKDQLVMPDDDWRVTWYDHYADMPTPEHGSFVWSKTVITYDKGDIPQVSYMCGKIGQDGVGYLGTEEYYALSSSNQTPPGGWNHVDGSGRYVPQSPWNEARPTSSPNASTPYLWNFEISYDTEGNQRITEPICIGNFARGIAAILELYAISNESVLSNTVKALNWTDEVYDAAPTDAKPYQWNKVITAYNDSTKTNGQWNEDTCDVHYHISAVKGSNGTRGNFKSTVFCRFNPTQQQARPATPTGGDYDHPVPDGWHDGAPAGAEMLWSSSCTFYGGGGSSGWSVPAAQSDTSTLDLEFSPSNTQPNVPTGNTPFSNHESEGWYDPSSPNFSTAGLMIWRAERKVRNGQYEGSWVITRIYGEKGDPGDSFAYRGHWHTGVVASVNDVDEMAGNLYICKQDNTDVPPVMTLLKDGAGNRVLNGEGGYVIIDEAINSSYYDYFLEGLKQPEMPHIRSVLSVDEYYARGTTDNPSAPPSVPVLQDSGKVYFDEAVWSKDRPREATNAEYPYLWNFELTNFSDGTQSFSYPHCIGNFSDGIADLQNYYQISAKSEPEIGREYPSDILSWTTEVVVPTDAKPYQWNKEVVRMAGGGEKIYYHISSVKGAKGDASVRYYMIVHPDSITKNADNQFVNGNYVLVNMYRQSGSDVPVHLTDFNEVTLQISSDGTVSETWRMGGTYRLLLSTDVTRLTINLVSQVSGHIVDTKTVAVVTNGSQGLQGCVTRVTEWKANTEYRNDDGVDFSQGSQHAIGYIDVVARPDDVNATGWKFYRCLSTHTSGSSFSLTVNGTTVWEELSDAGPLYTSLLIAKNAYIKFGTGNQFVITSPGATKSSGTVSKPSGYTWQYNINNTSWQDYSGQGISKPGSGSVVFRLLEPNGAIISRAEVPTLPTSGFTLVVDKNYDTVLKSSDGVIGDTLSVIKAYIYSGQGSISYAAGTWSITGTGCTIDSTGYDGNAKVIKVTGMSRDTATITIKCTFAGVQKSYTVSLVRRQDSVKYAISVNPVAALTGTSYVYASLYSWTKGDKVVAGMRGTGISDDSVRIWAGSTSENDISTAPFRVTQAGKLIATNAEITGKIIATDGEFTGVIHARDGEFTGTIIANNGSIGGFKISSTQLSATADGKTTILQPSGISFVSGVARVYINHEGIELYNAAYLNVYNADVFFGFSCTIGRLVLGSSYLSNGYSSITSDWEVTFPSDITDAGTVIFCTEGRRFKCTRFPIFDARGNNKGHDWSTHRATRIFVFTYVTAASGASGFGWLEFYGA